MKKIIKALAVIASICGLCFLFKDSIKEALSAIKGKLSNDDFDDFDDDDFDEDKIFGKSSDREYVDITIDDEDDAEAEDETAEESDETEA